MRVQVRKCPFTGVIFEESNIQEYIEHLFNLRENMKKERKFQRIRSSFKAWLWEEKQKITDINMVVPWFLKNQSSIMDAHNAINCPRGKSPLDDPFYKTDKFINITLRAYYSDRVSNSHRCPDNGVTNWCARDPNLPTGYPGFQGRIEGALVRSKKNNNSYPYTDALNLVGIKTGTGGGGNGSWGYDVSLFLADWPGLSQTALANKIAGKES